MIAPFMVQAADPGRAPVSVALLLTDVAGSTRLWEADADAMAAALARHDQLSAELVGAAGGRVIRPRGEGDSIFAVFDDAAAAVAGALALQGALTRETWPEPVLLRVRMAVHCGIAEQREDQLYGTEVNRCARLRQLARPGEVLVSDAAASSAAAHLPPSASLLDLGSHRLKDVARPERIHRLVHPDLPADFPPIAPASSHPNNLPLQVTSFIGRDREAEDLANLVRNRPLVTLHGPGGVGKTRLAVETADVLLEEFPDGVWFVDLSAVTDATSVPLAVAGVLGVRDQPGRSATATLVDHLRDARVLMVLDNCEHVVGGVAPLVTELLAACGGLRVLATSRSNLGVYGENIFALAPMVVPAAVSSLAALMEVPAARLLVERVREVRTRYEPADSDAPVIAAVCRRLDGMPLAMELAAARASSLSLAQIEQRLDDRFRLLRGGSPARPARQQTLEALVDWSYSLLDAGEQLVLRRLSVFTGPFDLEAAEQVAGVAPVDDADVVDILDRLVRRSLLVAVPEDPLPYHQLDTIRAYTHGELVETGEFEATATRHAAYHLALAEQHEYADAAGVARIRASVDNLRSALQRCVDSGEEDMALRICTALLPVWTGEGHLREARLWLSRALAMSDRADALRVRALCSAAWLAIALHEYAAAADESSRALALSERCDDHATRARAHHAVARSAFFRGDFETARTHLAANLDAARAASNQYLVSDALTLQGLLSGHVDGDWPAALAMLRQARDIVRQLGDAVGEVPATFHVGLAEECSGDTAAALATYRSTVQLAESTGYHEFLYCAACALARHAGSAAAARHLDAALASLAAVDGLNAHRALEAGATLALASGEWDLALTLVGAASLSAEDITEGPSGICDAISESARAAVGDQTADELLAEGRGVGAAAALDLVRVLAVPA
jgi:predicted ATPase/class 3 adenylate cyclase